ncbi:L-ascorbate metabolism protein UlaG (beta-lactamase superfamily) [Lewinella aquimaris]|uniref:L-ascorbate metabolism protein UlaG (Beta-lactamase superfamily) n=1 Tax=Neolewinella aquimaris TaxID=1835722 RepID=A0A840EB47_9BACT|nr:MBL fold metallo-hydrolase [Neolewinella aquimaris]MBB4080667.1 L-ascorbate metabolism protein UlaG (beta-lactamase superfamily) [Neolewinella aquimaris]
MEYLLNPTLPVHPSQAGQWRGNPIIGKEFQYLRQPFRPKYSRLMRMLVMPNPQRTEKKADQWTPRVSEDVEYLADRNRDWIVWLGHACYLMQLNGLRYLTDPQLRDIRMAPRRVFPPFDYEQLRGVDYLLLSHDHRDHVDERCIRAITKNNDIRKILCPLRMSSVIGGWVGDTVIEEAAWFQRYDLAGTGVDIHFLPSRHWCRRGLRDFNRVLWGSFMIETGGGGAGARKIYFGGDSGYTPYWEEIGQMFPGIDLAMLGIGAYMPEYVMREVHANPAEAFTGYRDLQAQYWWPMHHGTYDLSNEPPAEPILWATKLMGKHGLGDRLVQPAVNEPWWFG